MKRNINTNSQVIKCCQHLHQKSLISAFGGNVSVRSENKIIITPTGLPLREVAEDDLVVVNMAGEVLFGMGEPSSELALHLAIYRNWPHIKGIIHTHSPAATAFAYLGREIQAVNPESMEYLKDIPIVPYRPIGSDSLADALEEVVRGGRYNAILLERHGLITVGSNLDVAYNLTELVEETAKINLYIKILQNS
ncbi:class II aldolase/adducin family protein [Gehongia tenuis]|uniref:Class II aldolase/adducin family protein n=1 Tax=Gehongia tenuis TaxID=2763655 RepID=A0A926HKG2_9FIRM|nr:class II aldolase/adducin family protein [Gehongia tenuis]MBC8530942.1 class II aldolase/adducin family protein [Gehongia tenuis]